jgi:hypothetical protein
MAFLAGLGGQRPISPPRRSASGYKNNRPKWKKAEKELNDKGITPETSGWTEREKEWFYGGGGQLNPEIGLCIYTKEHLAQPYKALKTAHQEV